MDYSRYNDEELLEALGHIDGEKYPENHRALLEELGKRGLLEKPAAPSKELEPSEYTPHRTVAVRHAVRHSVETVLDELHRTDKKTFNPWYLLVISVLLFFALGSLVSDKRFLLLIIPVILIHELGHLVAMKILGYKNTKILFVPFLGGLASGSSDQNHQGKQAVISLAGPFVGTLSGFLLVFALGALHAQGHPALEAVLDLVLMTFLLNALNLLPFPPLDGGRLVEELIAGRNAVVELLYRIVGLGVLAWAAFALREWSFGLVALLMLPQIRIGIMNRKILARAKGSGGLRRDALDAENVRILLEAVEEQNRETRAKPYSLQIMAARVRQLHQLANRREARWYWAVLLLIVYAATLLMAVGGAAFALDFQKSL